MTVTTKFYFFLRSLQPPRDTASVYQEVQSFGPYVDSGVPKFSEFTKIDILEDNPEDGEVRAVCDGIIRCIRVDPQATTIMLRLTPTQKVWDDLWVILGNKVEIPMDFLYDNIDINSLDPVLTPIINEERARNPDDTPLADCIQSFKNGEYPILVRGGDIIGKASEQGTVPGNLRLHFAITTEAFDFTKLLYPAAFYKLLVAYNGAGAPVIAQVDQDNNLLTARVWASRVLLEIRTEYNTPYTGPVTITDGSGTTLNPMIVAENQGFVEVPDGWTQYQVSMRGHAHEAGSRQTSIPDGDNGYSEISRNLTAPAQWTIQTINLDSWFAEQDPWPDESLLRLPRWTENNKVEFLIDGTATFRKMIDAMNTVNSSSHSMHLAAWHLTQDMEMTDGTYHNNMAAYAQQLKALEAHVRILEWHVNATISKALAVATRLGVTPLTSLEPEHDPSTKHALVHWLSDSRIRSGPLEVPIGAHHQKIMIVKGFEGTIAFCGGIDIENLYLSRLDTPNHNINRPCHDVHCQVEGPAVLDLAETFRQRYNEFTLLQAGVDAADQIEPISREHPFYPPLTSTSGSHFVQIARTYPNRVGYSFAPTGDRTIRATLLRAISQARRYIYIEDQYLVSMEISRAIQRVLYDIERLIIVTNVDTDLHQDNYRRREFIRPLKTAYPDKVHVFTLRKDRKNIYCHSKVMIIDDIFVSIGSANLNRRGLTHDSECNVFVIDGQVKLGVRKFARDLRLALWSEHLGLRGESGRGKIADPTSNETLACWTRSPSDSSNRAVPYDENANIETPGLPITLNPPWDVIAVGIDALTWELQWDLILDPDGSTP